MTQPKLHVVSSGSYSDYSLEAILEQQPGEDFDALVREFDELMLARIPTEPDGDDGHEWWKWFSETRPAVWGAPTREAGLVKWLKEQHGYREYEFDDKNI